MSLLKTTPVAAPEGGSTRPVRRDNDRVVKHILTALALVSVAVIFFIIVFILYNSWDAIREVGILDFIFDMRWQPSSGYFGAAPLILGTILVTAGAMVIAIPLGVGAAIFLSEIASDRVRNIVKPVCEVFAGIPSVIFGFFGMVIIVPLLMDLFPDQASGSCWLAASIVLGIMAVPTIMSVSDDALKAVPRSYREASLAMGATRWETIRKVVFPAAVSGVSAAIILGIGRALGETMAVIMVAGNGANIPEPIYNVFEVIRTITSSIASEMPDVVIGSLHYSALFLLALILMAFIVIVNLVARRVIDSNRRRMGLGADAGRRGIASFIPDGIASFLDVHRNDLFKGAMAVLVFIFVSAMMSLFVGAAESVVVAAVVVAGGLVISYFTSRRTNPRMIERCAVALLYASVIVIMAVLAVMIADIVIKGAPAISWEFLTSAPSDGGASGGIAPAILGTLELIVGTAVIALPLGVVTGVWLSQYSGNGRIAGLVRGAADALNGTPSIVFGLFGMAVFVVMAGWGYSLLGGCFTLAFMILPVIIRTTEEAVSAVPHDLLEASMAMGASKWQSIVRVIIPAAMGGIMTGSILGLGRAAGETAPIMVTATTSFSMVIGFTGLMSPVMALPFHLYYLAMEVPGSETAQYGTALVLLVMVLVMFGIASLIRYKYSRNTKW